MILELLLSNSVPVRLQTVLSKWEDRTQEIPHQTPASSHSGREQGLPNNSLWSPLYPCTAIESPLLDREIMLVPFPINYG